MKHGCTVMTLRLSSSRRSGSRQIHRGQKVASSLQQNQVHADIFFRHPVHCPPGQTVNGKFCCEVLKWLMEGIRHKSPEKWKKNNWFLQHDNAPAHTSLVVPQFLTSKNITVIPRQPYSPDLAPCHFFLLPKIKLRLKGRRFDTSEEIHPGTQEVIDTRKFEKFQGCMKSWETHWDRCIHAQGDYFEGDGGN